MEATIRLLFLSSQGSIHCPVIQCPFDSLSLCACLLKVHCIVEACAMFMFPYSDRFKSGTSSGLGYINPRAVPHAQRRPVSKDKDQEVIPHRTRYRLYSLSWAIKPGLCNRFSPFHCSDLQPCACVPVDNWNPGYCAKEQGRTIASRARQDTRTSCPTANV